MFQKLFQKGTLGGPLWGNPSVFWATLVAFYSIFCKDKKIWARQRKTQVLIFNFFPNKWPKTCEITTCFKKLFRKRHPGGTPVDQPLRFLGHFSRIL